VLSSAVVNLLEPFLHNPILSSSAHFSLSLPALLSPLVLLWGLLAIDQQVLFLFLAKGKLCSYPFFLRIANYENVLQLSSGSSAPSVVRIRAAFPLMDTTNLRRVGIG